MRGRLSSAVIEDFEIFEVNALRGDAMYTASPGGGVICRCYLSRGPTINTSLDFDHWMKTNCADYFSTKYSILPLP